MAFNLFENEKSGTSNFDPYGGRLEDGVKLPFPQQPGATWVYYQIDLETHLDSGIVVHNRLPSVDNEADTLSNCDIISKTADKIAAKYGVNLKSNDKFTDIVQRMAHSRYWFHLYGQAMRIGLQVPIPGIKVICGQPAIPHDENPQRGSNRNIGNYSGAILWHATWSLWYTIASAPNGQNPALFNPAQHTADDAIPPKDFQAPWSQPDDLATRNRETLSGLRG